MKKKKKSFRKGSNLGDEKSLGPGKLKKLGKGPEYKKKKILGEDQDYKRKVFTAFGDQNPAEDQTKVFTAIWGIECSRYHCVPCPKKCEGPRVGRGPKLWLWRSVFGPSASCVAMPYSIFQYW